MARFAAVTAFTLSILAGPLAAQTVPVAHADRAWGLQIAVLDGDTGEVGVVKSVSDVVQIGLGLGYRSSSREVERLDRMTESDQSFWTMTFRPSVRRYLGDSETIAPFLTGSVALEFGESETVNRSSESVAVGRQAFNVVTTRVGFGAEWFPDEPVSLGGFTGLRVRYSDSDRDTQRTETWQVDTFVTSLIGRYYF